MTVRLILSLSLLTKLTRFGKSKKMFHYQTIDSFFSEHEILREEIKSLQDVRSRLQQRIQELEDELKKVRDEAEAAKATK